MGDYIVWNNLSGITKLLMNQLHYGGFAFMVLAYAYKIYQLLQKPAAGEGTPARGDHNKAIMYAYMTLAMPWELESQKKNLYRYVEFAVFHIAMAVGIGFAFVVPMIPKLMQNALISFCAQFFFVLGFVIGISRLVRRLKKPEMRVISTPDDIFCLVLLTVWMFAGIFAAPLKNEFWLFMYYLLATFFLFYVPFSKISHYVYYGFIRFYVGKHFGHRGTWPKKHVSDQAL